MTHHPTHHSIHRLSARSRRLPIALCACFAAAAPAIAAVPQPVHWQATAPHGSIHPGQKFDITLTGAIDPGWHVYALEEPDGGPVATTVGLAEADPANLLRVTAARPTTLTDPQFNMQTQLYLNTVAFTLHLQAPRTPSTPGPQTLHALVRYQSCDSHVCLPPHTDTVPVPINFAR